MEIQNSFIQLVEESIRKNWNLDALTDYKGATLQYRDVARKIEKMHILFEHAGIKKGDKIALCGRNSANWTAAFLGIVTYGAVAVPILHEFKADNVHHIVNHSEARMLFVGDQVWENFNERAMPNLEGIIELKNYDLVVSRSKKLTYAREHLNEEFGKKYPCRLRAEQVAYRREDPEELAVINYTSGTTGYSKGVMLPLPQHHFKHRAHRLESRAEAGRPDRIDASAGTYFRTGIRLPLRHYRRSSPVVSYTHAKPENHRRIVCRHPSPRHRLRAPHR